MGVCVCQRREWEGERDRCANKSCIREGEPSIYDHSGEL